jgi:hypothetical protein
MKVLAAIHSPTAKSTACRAEARAKLRPDGKL